MNNRKIAGFDKDKIIQKNPTLKIGGNGDD